jgi:lon-related putative ATP-dependent protease
MSKVNELPYNMLKREFDSNLFSFNDTSEIQPFHGVIGQERAERAMEFGLKIKMRGYNVYMSGVTGTGKTSYAQKFISEVAKDESVPEDWCYVYNFNNPNQPTAVNLPAGKGKLFHKDMEEFVKIIEQEIIKAFSSEDYEKEKANIVKEFQSKRDEIIEKLSKNVEEKGFKVKSTDTGVYFLPVVEGKVIDETEYDELDEETRGMLSEKLSAIQMQTIEIVRKIKNIEREAEQKVEQWDNKIALFAVGEHIDYLKKKYAEYKKIVDYLDNVQEDILASLDDFLEEEVADSQTQLIIPWAGRDGGSPTDKYVVNLLVDNSSLEGAPVVVDFNPTFYNLLGKLEYENEFGTMTTDFTLIKAGLFHLANGGYLILQAKDVLNNAQVWESMKRVLRTREIRIENIKEQMGLVAVSTLKPEPIPVNIKVILIGSEHIYQLLYAYDEEFKKLFKIKADFDDEMDKNDENVFKLAQFISAFCEREQTLHFHKSGVAKVVEYASRLVEDQNKLTTRFNEVAEILCESCTWAQMEGSSLVMDNHVKKAIQEKNYRSNKYDKKLLKFIEEGTIMIDTQGEEIGQINGLSILDMGDYIFGKPSRITAATYMGESGIVNIEREIEMSGTSHTKGVLILSGYIGQKYARQIPLSLSASLCFEQLYSGIDGDSASSAELYAILSSLAEVPIKQGIAVTGSVNQKGEIQPIGGATYKIEGFFELCKLRGLNGEQGVIIPYQNARNLVLNDEVIHAVKEGMFHIYTVKTIDEGIKILTGIEAGEKLEDGTYPEGTINYRVYEKLKRFAQTVARSVKV